MHVGVPNSTTSNSSANFLVKCATGYVMFAIVAAATLPISLIPKILICSALGICLLIAATFLLDLPGRISNIFTKSGKKDH